jgi:hypothetical protein
MAADRDTLRTLQGLEAVLSDRGGLVSDTAHLYGRAWQQLFEPLLAERDRLPGHLPRRVPARRPAGSRQASCRPVKSGNAEPEP